MGVLDMLARAEVSSDLAHHERHCDVDVLGAAGMAAAGNVRHMAVFRVKYLNDDAELPAAKRYFIQVTRIHMIRRKINPAGASRLGTQILSHWLNDVCPACHGLKYMAIDGAPALSDKQCQPCKGTGRRKLPYGGPELEVVRDVIERADSAVHTIQRGMNEKMGWGEK